MTDEEETTEKFVSNGVEYEPYINSAAKGNPSKHSAFGSTTNGVSNRALSPQNPVKAIQCTATARSTGKRCGRFSVRGTNVCIKHGASFPSVRAKADAVTEAARMRLLEMSDQAIDVIEDLSLNATAEQVRLKASTEILDRAGIRGGVEIDFGGEVTHTIETAADRTRKQLAETSARLAEARRLIEEKANSVPGPTDGSDALDEDIVDVEEVVE